MRVFIFILPEKQDKCIMSIAYMLQIDGGVWFPDIVPPPPYELHSFSIILSQFYL